MGSISDWWYGRPDGLKLRTANDSSRSQMMVPKAPEIVVSSGSLRRYATKSELAYACINKKCQAATDPELIVQRRNSDDDWESVPGHPAAALLNHPNPTEPGEAFIRSWIASLNVSGVFYAEIVKSNAGVPVQMYPLIPTHVFPQYIETWAGTVVDYYSYFINGYEVRFKPEELLICRLHSLGSIFGGVSPLSVALETVDADIACVEYVRSILNNGGTPSGILNIKGRKLSETELEAYQQKWMSRYGRNGTNRGGPAILDSSEIDYQSIGTKLNELGTEELTSKDESRICMVFGVPPILIGAYVGLLHVNQRASVREAQQDFWMNTMSPDLKSIRKFLDHTILPMFEDSESVRKGLVRFNWDMTQVDALQEEVETAHKRIGEAYKGGIYKLNEARAALGLDAVEDEVGEQFYKAPPTLGTIASENPKTLLIRPNVKSGPAPSRLELKGTRRFSSTQIDLKAPAKGLVLAAGSSNIADDDLYIDPDDPGYGREIHPHITVKYGIHSNDPEEVRELLSGEKAFTVTLGKTAIFPAADDREYDVVIVKVKSSNLRRLNKLISENVEVTDTFSEYRPHVTLAYVEAGKGEQYAGRSDLESIEIIVDSIIFSDQEGKKTTIALSTDSGKSEKKTFEFDGTMLGREPSETERSIDLKAINDSFEFGADQLTKIVLQIRDELHSQAAKAVRKLDATAINTLTLTPPANAYKNVRKVLKQSFAEGQRQISEQAQAAKSLQTKGDFLDGLERIVELTIARIVGQVSTAVVEIVTALGVLGYDRDEIEDEILERLDERSDKPYESYSRQAVNTSVNLGRREEMESRRDEIRLYEYSAILDKNTCDSCGEWDGKQADDIDDLPETPNSDCEGGANCRCFIISIFAGEEN